MRLPLSELEQNHAIVRLTGRLSASDSPVRLEYRTRTGALLRVDGAVAGAFDREHTAVIVDGADHERTLTLEVERHALPTNHLPSGDGVMWKWILHNATQDASRSIDVHGAPPVIPSLSRDALRQAQGDTDELPLWGHSHLDVAWLWSYSETRRKAMRTFANALAVAHHDDAFIFMQSQPQLYAYVEQEDPPFFERVRAAVQSGHFDPSPAALWVEPDCNLISGESLLRQMLFAHRYCTQRFGIEPSIAWLPDTFGFPNTLPTLLAHAGIPYFASTKLQWNDTTTFPYPQFRWRGPDGSEIVSAMLASYEGSATSKRVALAEQRHEPLVIGYSDGGGGPTLDQVQDAQRVGRWQRPQRYFDHLASRAQALPLHDDELYLEYHRGVYTTHHDVKANNAFLERALVDVEERIAWCCAVHAPSDVVARLREQVDAVWEIVLRNQFHDVLPGTSVRSAYDEVADEYARAIEMIEFVRASTEAMLPRAARRGAEPAPCRPVLDDGEYVLDNGIVRARLNDRGTLLELSGNGARTIVAQANLLAAYRDRPRKWEAWNIDAGYERHRVSLRPIDHESTGDGLTVRFDVAGSPLTMRVSLLENEPFLRVDVAVDWKADRVLLRMENWFTASADAVRFGTPHGTIDRPIGDDTAMQRAKFEVPGQRFASVAQDGAGLAILSLDTYGWSARRLPRGGVALGHSLLRAPRWPDPMADRGEGALSWAFVPHAAASTGALEHVWRSYAMPSSVRLFTSDDPAALIVAVKPAADGNGVVARVRECDGRERPVRLRCGARVRSVAAVDGLERPVGDAVSIEGETLVATIPAFGLRTYRVTF